MIQTLLKGKLKMYDTAHSDRATPDNKNKLSLLVRTTLDMVSGREVGHSVLCWVRKWFSPVNCRMLNREEHFLWLVRHGLLSPPRRSNINTGLLPESKTGRTNPPFPGVEISLIHHIQAYEKTLRQTFLNTRCICIGRALQLILSRKHDILEVPQRRKKNQRWKMKWKVTKVTNGGKRGFSLDWCKLRMR